MRFHLQFKIQRARSEDFIIAIDLDEVHNLLFKLILEIVSYRDVNSLFALTTWSHGAFTKPACR